MKCSEHDQGCRTQGETEIKKVITNTGTAAAAQSTVSTAISRTALPRTPKNVGILHTDLGHNTRPRKRTKCEQPPELQRLVTQDSAPVAPVVETLADLRSLPPVDLTGKSMSPAPVVVAAAVNDADAHAVAADNRRRPLRVETLADLLSLPPVDSSTIHKTGKSIPPDPSCEATSALKRVITQYDRPCNSNDDDTAPPSSDRIDERSEHLTSSESSAVSHGAETETRKSRLLDVASWFLEAEKQQNHLSNKKDTRRSKPRATPPSIPGRNSFPERLRDLLEATEKDGLDRAFRWQPHGRALKVCDRNVMEKIILPKYFGTAKYASFMRQLSLWNFQRITQGPDKGSYWHPDFVRDEPELARDMRRTKINGFSVRQKPDPDSEPNFYALSSSPKPNYNP